MSINNWNGQENVIEFINGDERAFVTFSERRFINLVKRLAKRYPADVKIIDETKSHIYASVPTSFVGLRNTKRELTEEQKKEIGERLAIFRTPERCEEKTS